MSSFSRAPLRLQSLDIFRHEIPVPSSISSFSSLKIALGTANSI